MKAKFSYYKIDGLKSWIEIGSDVLNGATELRGHRIERTRIDQSERSFEANLIYFFASI